MILIELYDLRERLRHIKSTKKMHSNVVDIIQRACIELAERNDSLDKVLSQYGHKIPPISMKLPADLYDAVNALISTYTKLPLIERFMYESCINGCIYKMKSAYSVYNTLLNMPINYIRVYIAEYSRINGTS